MQGHGPIFQANVGSSNMATTGDILPPSWERSAHENNTTGSINLPTTMAQAHSNRKPPPWTRSWALRLSLLFLVWKSLLLAAVLVCPAGEGYDSSTELFLRSHMIPSINASYALTPPQHFLARLGSRLTRWDAIYFASAAWRGAYVHEQDWAFSYGYTGLVSSLKQGK
jgi:hypothetical protein